MFYTDFNLYFYVITLVLSISFLYNQTKPLDIKIARANYMTSFFDMYTFANTKTSLLIRTQEP